MNFKSVFSCIFLLTLSALSFAQDQYQASAKFLSKALETPVVHQTFDSIQGNMLRTNIDLRNTDFFNRPVFQALKPMFQESIKQTVRQGIQKGEISMNDLTDGLTRNSLELEILDAAREVLRESGRTEEEVMNARIILADGDPNAYTFSGQNGELVIVIQTGLIKDLVYFEEVTSPNGKRIQVPHIRRDEVKAVIAHENGHVKSGHIDGDVGNMALFIQLFRYFGYSGLGSGTLGSDDFWTKMSRSLFRDFNPGSKSAIAQLRKNALLNAVMGVNQTFDLISQTPEGRNEVRSMLNDYLDMLIEITLMNGEMEPEVVRVLKAMRNGQGGMFPSELLQETFASVAAFVSRERETSADMFTFNSLARAYAAAPFAGFGGALFTATPNDGTTTYTDDLVMAIQKRLLANEKLYKDATTEELQDLLGGSNGDHPFEGQRVENIVKYGNTLDAMAMNNEFIRLYVTHGGLLEAESQLQASKIKIEDKIKLFSKLSHVNSSPKIAEVLAGLKALLKQTNQNIIDSKKSAQDFASEIKLILRQGSGVSGLKGNPALADLLDFQAGKKIRILWTIDELTKALSSATENEAEEISIAINGLKKQLSGGDSFLEEIRADIPKGPLQQQTISKIDKILDPNLSIKEAREVRKSILKEIGYQDSLFTKRTHAPIGKEVQDIRESSIMKNHLPKRILSERRKQLERQADEWSPALIPQPISLRQCTGLFRKVAVH